MKSKEAQYCCREFTLFFINQPHCKKVDRNLSYLGVIGWDMENVHLSVGLVCRSGGKITTDKTRERFLKTECTVKETLCLFL